MYIAHACFLTKGFLNKFEYKYHLTVHVEGAAEEGSVALF